MGPRRLIEPALACSTCGEARIEDAVAKLEGVVEMARERQAAGEVTEWEQVAERSRPAVVGAAEHDVRRPLSGKRSRDATNCHPIATWGRPVTSTQKMPLAIPGSIAIAIARTTSAMPIASMRAKW